jgi:hypothetical protein
LQAGIKTRATWKFLTQIEELSAQPDTVALTTPFDFLLNSMRPSGDSSRAGQQTLLNNEKEHPTASKIQATLVSCHL